MKCSNCLTKVNKKYITVCQQCLIDIENEKDYLQKEVTKLRRKLAKKKG